MKKKHMLLLIAALAIQSPFGASRAHAIQACPDTETFTLWNALNELSAVLPGFSEIPKTIVAVSKIATKETGNRCSLSMANLMRMMAEIADEKIDENAIKEINTNWETAKQRFNEIGNYPSDYYLQGILDDLNNWENGCTNRSFGVRPAMVGMGLLKLSLHQLLIANADMSNDGDGNTDTARYYTESYRMLNAVEQTRTRLATIENKFKQYVDSVNYSLREHTENWDGYTWYGDVILPLANGSWIQGPDLSCTYSILDPGAIDRTRKELVKAGEKLVADWKADQLGAFYDSDYRQLTANIDKIRDTVSDRLNSRNYAYKKDSFLDGQRSASQVDGSRNSVWSLPSAPKVLNWKLDLGEPLPNSPQGIESIAFKTQVGMGTYYTITLLGQNGHVLKTINQYVVPATNDYVINFRQGSDSGRALVARYVTIRSTSSLRAVLNEVYCFTNNIAPTTTPWQNSTQGTHWASNAINFFANQNVPDGDDLYSATLQEPNNISRWSTGFKRPMQIGAVVITTPVYDPNKYYEVELMDGAGIPIGYKKIRRAGTVRVEFETTKWASRLRISGAEKNLRVMLSDVQIYKKGDSN